MGNERNFISFFNPFNTQSDGISPNATMPLPRTADKLKSDVFATALTELRNNSGAAEPKATRVTATPLLNDVSQRLSMHFLRYSKPYLPLPLESQTVWWRLPRLESDAHRIEGIMYKMWEEARPNGEHRKRWDPTYLLSATKKWVTAFFVAARFVD